MNGEKWLSIAFACTLLAGILIWLYNSVAIEAAIDNATAGWGVPLLCSLLIVFFIFAINRKKG